MVGHVDARIGAASQPNNDVGQSRETEKNTNGAEILRLLKDNGVATSNNGVKSHNRNGLGNA